MELALKETDSTQMSNLDSYDLILDEIVPEEFKRAILASPDVQNTIKNGRDKVVSFNSENAKNMNSKQEGIDIEGYTVGSFPSEFKGTKKYNTVVIVTSLKNVYGSEVVNGRRTVECPQSFFPTSEDLPTFYSMIYLSKLIKAKKPIPDGFKEAGIRPDIFPGLFYFNETQKKTFCDTHCSDIFTAEKSTVKKFKTEDHERVDGILKDIVEGYIKGGKHNYIFAAARQFQDHYEQFSGKVSLLSWSWIKIASPSDFGIKPGTFVKISGLKASYTINVSGEKFSVTDSYKANIARGSYTDLSDFWKAAYIAGIYLNSFDSIINKSNKLNDGEELMESIDGQKTLQNKLIERSTLVNVSSFNRDYMTKLMTEKKGLYIFYETPQVDDTTNNLAMQYGNEVKAQTAAKAPWHAVNQTVLTGYEWNKPVFKLEDGTVKKLDSIVKTFYIKMDMWQNHIYFFYIANVDVWKTLGVKIIQAYRGLNLVTLNAKKTEDMQRSLDKLRAAKGESGDDEIGTLDLDAYMNNGGNDQGDPVMAINPFKQPDYALVFDMIAPIMDIGRIYESIGVPITPYNIFKIMKTNFRVPPRDPKDSNVVVMEKLNRSMEDFQFSSEYHHSNYHSKPSPEVICINEYDGKLSALKKGDEWSYKFVVIGNGAVTSGKEFLKSIKPERGHLLFDDKLYEEGITDESRKKFWDERNVPFDDAIRKVSMTKSTVKYIFAIKDKKTSDLEKTVNLFREKMFDDLIEEQKYRASLNTQNTLEHEQVDASQKPYIVTEPETPIKSNRPTPHKPVELVNHSDNIRIDEYLTQPQHDGSNSPQFDEDDDLAKAMELADTITPPSSTKRKGQEIKPKSAPKKQKI
jgi:hypothetical protein